METTQTMTLLILMLAIGIAVGWAVKRARHETEPAQLPEAVTKRLAALISVKSLVTLALTVIFAIQTCRGELDANFMTIYTAVMSFYFGIQSTKEGGSNANG